MPNKTDAILIVLVLLFGISFIIIYSNPPTIISVDPVSINESFSVNDSYNESIEDIAIKNMGPHEINLSAILEIGNHTRNMIDVSFVPSENQLIKSGEVKFLSVIINASKASEGDYKASIILNTSDEKVYEIIPVTIDIIAAESDNSSSV